MGRFTKIAVVMFSAVFIPAVASAQASIVGVVRDASGGVLPGVTVEAASPALIEKVRTVVTDGTGQYRVVDLRPGVYTVTFTLPGFSTVRREGVELGGNFTATVNADLRVGTVEETITVTGESPVVDIQSTRQQQAIDREVISAIPSGRAFQHVAALIPAMQNQGGAQDVGGTRGPASTSDRYVVHGGLITDSRVQVEGLGVASADAGGASGTYYMPNMASTQEVVINTSGGGGESETGGVRVNVVPREGGNTLRGSFFMNGANESMQSSNYTQALKDQGLRAPNRVAKIMEISPSFGGPIFPDRLWYFFSARYLEANNYVAGMYYNLNAGNPNAWTYEPDYSRQVISDSDSFSYALRLTWQATPRNKFNIFWDDQPRCAGCPGGTATTSPEAANFANGKPNRVQQATWSSPLTNKILLEAGFGTYLVLYGWLNEPPMVPELIRVTEQAGIIPGLSYRGTNLSRNWNGSYNWRASTAYVTGAHAAKVGYQGMLYDRTPSSYSLTGGLSYRFNNGVPNQLTQTMSPLSSTAHLWVHALYAQDQWTIDRLTLDGSLRYDHFGSYFPDQQLGPNNFLSEAFVFPGHKGVSFNDLSPRMGAAYDLFGTGKTAVKVMLNKYMLGQESSAAGTFGSFVGPIVRLATSTTRSWNDANRDYVPNCDLRSPAANGECGAMANRNFGTNVFSVTFDPAVLSGWGIRPYQWEFSAAVQHQLMPRVAANVGYFRRWYGNFAVTDNRATEPSDYTLFRLPVPADPRLPGSGGTLTFQDINPAKFGQVNTVVTAASNYGNQVQRWHGIDASLDVRPQGGLFFQGGISVGRTINDNCEIVDKLPEVRGTMPVEYCRVVSPFLTQVKGFAGYMVPRIDVQLSGGFQNVPGAEIVANYNAPNAVIAPLLGRNLSGGAANTTLSLVAPLSLYGGRINQLDLRVAKILTFGRVRTQFAFDLYNALNSNAVQTINSTFGPSWQTPTSIITARLAKVGMQLDF